MIPGTVLVQSVIAPSSEQDTYPTHEARFGRGGYRTAANLTARNSIPQRRREAGMLVYVRSNRKIYMLDHDLVTWLDFGQVMAALIAPFLNLQMPDPPDDGGEEPPPDDDEGIFCPTCQLVVFNNGCPLALSSEDCGLGFDAPPPDDGGGGEEPPPDDGGNCPVCSVPDSTTNCPYSSLQPPPGGECGLGFPIAELCEVCGANAAVTTICPINSDDCGLGLTELPPDDEPPPDDGGGDEPPPDDEEPELCELCGVSLDGASACGIAGTGTLPIDFICPNGLPV